MSRTKTDIQKYCDCMEEIKLRSNLIFSIVNGKITLGKEIFDYELICIQLRKILELIALSSLVSNKRVYSETYEDFHSHWNAKKILNALEKINPNFYPVPAQIDPKGKIGSNNAYHMKKDSKKSALTKNEFVRLYNICGSILHTKNPYAQKKNIDIEIPIDSWMKKIAHLLNQHYIQLVDGSFWLIHMIDPQDKKAHAYTLTPKVP